LLRRVALWGVALFIACWFLYFAGRGIWAPITGDDLMNLHGYLLQTPRTLLLDNLRYWSTAYRPLGGLFYVGLYHLFGFTSLPFRLVCFALLGFNLVLLFRFCRLLSGSNEVAATATLLVGYHAWFTDLYYSSGTIYDVLCFTFFFAALDLYISIRRASRLPSLWETLLLIVLYISALNAKEMAVTLPLFLGIYECLYHPQQLRPILRWPLKEGRTMVLTGLFTIPYAIVKTTGPGSLAEQPLYHLTISPLRFFKTFHLYLNPLFYRDHFFHDSNTGELLAAMLVFAVLRRSRSLLFALFFLLLSMLPVAFIPHYSAFFLYIPIAGWALYGADTLVWGRKVLLRGIAWSDAPGIVMVSQAILFLGLAAILIPLYKRESPAVMRLFLSQEPPVGELTSGLLRIQAHLKRGAHVLFVDDPFPKDQYLLVFITRLVYGDMTIQIDRTAVQPRSQAEYRNYDAVFRFRDGHLATPDDTLKRNQ
jgi:uncharacterized membrane protein YGL010W